MIEVQSGKLLIYGKEVSPADLQAEWDNLLMDKARDASLLKGAQSRIAELEEQLGRAQHMNYHDALVRAEDEVIRLGVELGVVKSQPFRNLWRWLRGQ